MSKDYDDECPVFRFRHRNIGYSYDTEVFGWGRRDSRSEAYFEMATGWAYLDELSPLTPAAVELLAAIRAELGLA